MATPSTLGQLVRASRNAAAMTQPQASSAAGVSVGTWSRVERDRLIPEPRYLAAMAAAVCITVAQLETIGQNDAADLLRSRLSQANGQRPSSPNSIVAAITNFQVTSLDLGWSVLIKHPNQDTYLIELRRDSSSTVAELAGS